MTIIVAEDQMSLAIGKKGQNVRLAAKLVHWKVDIKGPSEGSELGAEHAFLTSGKTSTVDFLDDIKNTKGLGEKVMTLLFNENVVTYEEAMKRGIKGLVLLPGIGPKKAEALMNLVEPHMKEVELAQESAEKETPKASEPDETVPETIESEPVADEPAEKEETSEEEEEIPIQELKGVPPEVLQTLISNGFETLAELSVTPLDELLSMEGIDEKIGRSILEQVKQRLENIENA
jgi:N utilization substance protein A